MPIQFPEDADLRGRIVSIVEELQKLDPDHQGLALIGTAVTRRIRALECELDDAVFDLYQLNAAERDLVLEMCMIGLDLFYRNQKSDAVKEVGRPALSAGVLADVANAKAGLPAYLRVFLESWKRELGADGELAWQVLSPSSRAPLLAVSFTMHEVTRETNAPVPVRNDGEDWRSVVTKLDRLSRVPAAGKRIFIDTFFRHVGDREILFIKRNEQRFWTRTAAREDAESTLTYLMNQVRISASGDR